jgi:PilZ domain
MRPAMAIHMLHGVLVHPYQESKVPSQILKTQNTMAPPHQRQNPRIRIQIPVFLRGTDALGADFIELTKTLNISSTGACIASSHILQTEQVIQLTIPTPSPSTAGLVPSETPPISARVLRQESAGDLRLFGLEFVHPLS